jgi:hypothetical protein
MARVWEPKRLTQNPFGKTVRVHRGNEILDFKVTGLMRLTKEEMRILREPMTDYFLSMCETQSDYAEMLCFITECGAIIPYELGSIM